MSSRSSYNYHDLSLFLTEDQISEFSKYLRGLNRNTRNTVTADRVAEALSITGYMANKLLFSQVYNGTMAYRFQVLCNECGAIQKSFNSLRDAQNYVGECIDCQNEIEQNKAIRVIFSVIKDG